jgi:hypothetical protein
MERTPLRSRIGHFYATTIVDYCLFWNERDKVFYARRLFDRLIRLRELGTQRTSARAECIEINCELEEWYCAPRDQVRDMFKAGDFEC